MFMTGIFLVKTFALEKNISSEEVISVFQLPTNSVESDAFLVANTTTPRTGCLDLMKNREVLRNLVPNQDCLRTSFLLTQQQKNGRKLLRLIISAALP